jgi:formylglycine-generating enzyme required for sulfatase activity
MPEKKLLAIVSFLLALSGPWASSAQARDVDYGAFQIDHDVTGMRGFHGSPSPIRRSFRSDREAQAILKRVLDAAGLAGLDDRIVLRSSAETTNAEAFIEHNRPLIFYNVEFMQRLRAQTNDYWSMVAILAHEVGHHVRFHTAIDGRNHEFELEADYQAGFILRRMGATQEQAVSAYKTFPEQETPTHPGRAQRIQSVLLGWIEGGDASRPVDPARPNASERRTPVPPAPAAPGTSGHASAPRASTPVKSEPLATTSAAKTPACPKVKVQVVGKGTVCVDPGDPANREFEDCGLARGRLFCAPRMVLLPRGTYFRGAGGDSANPMREVAINYDLAVGKFEATFADWDACAADGGCRHVPSDLGFGRGRKPVIQVSWNDVKYQFLPWLNRRLGLSDDDAYRLLSEAEWEYAARAGTTTAYSFGDTINRSHAMFREISFPASLVASDSGPADAGSYRANPWGLHDMHGNVWEWIEDCPTSYTSAPVDGSSGVGPHCEKRGLRGGSWKSEAAYLRSFHRNWDPATLRNDRVGFRVARVVGR